MNKSKLTIALLVCLLGLLPACTEDGNRGPIDPTYFEPIVIALGETQHLHWLDVDVTFANVPFDTRCPIGALCVWPGMAEVVLEINDTVQVTLPKYGDFGATPPSPNPAEVIHAAGLEIWVQSLDPYPSITKRGEIEYSATISIRPSPAGTEPVPEVIITDDPGPLLEISGAVLDSLSIIGDTLTFNAQYSGGCVNHYFLLYMSPAYIAQSTPAQVDLYLKHTSAEDPCDALITQTVHFDISPIKQYYQQLYGHIGDIRLVLHHPKSSVTSSIIYYGMDYGPPPVIPLGIDNYWIYEDTIYIPALDSIIVSTDSVVVTEMVDDTDVGSWYVLSHHWFGIENEMALVVDTVYTHQSGDMADYAEPEFIPAADTAIHFSTILQGDLLYERTVRILPTPFAVPAGNFAGVWEYSTENVAEVYWRVLLMPGVGFIYGEESLLLSPPLGTGRHVSILLRASYPVPVYLPD
ncbi:MAG: hypothetical protein KKA42_12375 [candidate division Zixibacteria bacterium]|nr:hypothetical protein [candidate division Zixibacteria bacterium]